MRYACDMQCAAGVGAHFSIAGWVLRVQQELCWINNCFATLFPSFSTFLSQLAINIHGVLDNKRRITINYWNGKHVLTTTTFVFISSLIISITQMTNSPADVRRRQRLVEFWISPKNGSRVLPLHLLICTRNACELVILVITKIKMYKKLGNVSSRLLI